MWSAPGAGDSRRSSGAGRTTSQQPSQYSSFYPAQYSAPVEYRPASSSPYDAYPSQPTAAERAGQPLLKSQSLGLTELVQMGFATRGRRGSADPSDTREYQNLKWAITDRFSTAKLNVRRAEIYLRVQKKTLQAMQLYRELLLYLIFVALFFTLVLRIVPVGTSYQQFSSFTGASWLNIKEVGKDPTAFSATDNPGDFFAWIKGRMLKFLDGTDAGNSMFLWYRKQAGAIRVRQIRSVPSTCDAINPTGLTKMPYKCYDSFPDTSEDRGILNGMFRWEDGLSDFFPSKGSMRDSLSWSYGTGGYAVDIPAGSLAQTAAAIDALETAGFVSEATRAIQVSINIQNPHTDTYIVGQFNVEFPATGASVPSVTVETLQLRPLSNPWTIVLAILVAVCSIVYVVNEFRQMWDAGIVEYVVADKWNVWDVANLGLIIALLGYTVAFHFWSDRIASQIAGGADPRVFYRLNEGVATMRTIVQLAGLAILLSCIRVYKFFELNPRLSVLTNTVGKAVPDLAAFLVIFVILFAGYAFMAWIIFGHRMEMFHSFYASFANLFGSLGGLGGLAGDILDASPGMGMFFYFSFVVTVSLILVNIFIAIVGKYYAEAGDDAVRREEEFETLISAEDRLAPLEKLNRARFDLKPCKTASFVVGKDDILRVWMSADHRDLATGVAGIAGGAAAAAASSSTAVGTGRRRASGLALAPTHEADSVGSRIMARCMMDVLSPGSEVCMYGVTDRRTGLLGYTGTFRVFQMFSGFVDFEVKGDRAIEIGEGSYCELSRRTYVRSLAELYLLEPATVQRRRVSKLFADYNLTVPEDLCVEEADLEHEIMGISDRNTELESKVHSGQDSAQVAAPKWLKRKTYHLDDMLAIIRKLERFAESHKSKQVERSMAPLVDEAVHIDSLYRAVVSEGKAAVTGLLAAGAGGLESASSSGKTITAHIGALNRAASASFQQAVRGRGKEPAGPPATPKRASTKAVYSLLMQAAEEFDRRCEEIFLNIIADDEGAADRDGDGEPDINYIRRSLRFDQVADLVRKLAIGSGASEVDIKKQTLYFLASFPASCFDTLKTDREKLEIFIPYPYNTKGIIGTLKDPAILLREAKIRVPVAAPAVAASPSLYGSTAGARAPGGVQEREVDMVELLGILGQDTWAVSKAKGGWRYTAGARSDASKEHPLLKPYFQLDKKDQDNNLVQGLEILRAAVCCGYEFVPPKGAVPPRIVEPAAGWEQFRNNLAPGYMPIQCVAESASKMEDPVVKELVDLLARNAHDHWAKAKKRDGFTYGHETDDTLLTHKDLMPYECLNLEQKKTNQEAAEATLRLILACGWEIKPSSSNIASGFFQKSWKQLRGLVKRD